MPLVAMALTVALGVAAVGTSVAADPAAGAGGKGVAFLDSELARVLEEVRAGAPAVRSLAGARSLPPLDERIKVSFVFRDEGSAEAAERTLPLLGAQVTARYRRLLDAWVPVAGLGELDALPGLMLAHRPFPPFRVRPAAAVRAQRSGAAVSEGVAASGADAWLGTGLDGNAIAVAVIDSFAGYDAAQAAGEVPAALAFNALDVTNPQGTACVEVVHDMAPGAEIVLASAATTTEAAAAIAGLAGAGVELITSSVQFVTPDAPPLAGPGREAGDGGSALCQAISDARAGAGTLYFQAAGNLAQSHWDGTYLDTDRDPYHEFAAGDEVDEIALGTASIATFLRWDDWPASSQDYDLELVVQNAGDGWDVVAVSQNPQDGTQPPWEFIEHVLDPAKQYGLRIRKYAATRNVFLSLSDLGQATLEHFVPARSLLDVAACPDAISVAAADAHAPDFAIKDTSSQGPTYGAGGIATGGWDQPRIAAYASVDTLSYGNDGFGGTGAAAPHVAGAAALVMQRQPTFTPDQVQAFLEARAVDIVGTPAGYDHLAGVGRLFLGDVGPCAHEVSPTGVALPREGGSGSFDVATGAGCPWEATSSAAWLTVISGSPDTGPGAVAYNVAANGGSARTATITVGGAAFTVDQAAATCSFELGATGAAMAAAGGDGDVGVTANIPDCEWEAVSNAAWITISDGASGTGDGTVSFSVAANDGEARTGTLTIAGLLFTIEQEAAPCSFELSAASLAMGAAGGAGSVEVAANLSSCAWTAVANDPWIAVTGGAAETGNGTVSFSVAANDGEARTGTITVAGLTFSVDQEPPPCAFDLSPEGVEAAAGGAEIDVAVAANLASCAWSATANAPWLEVTSGASGSGDGAVHVKVAANSGEARTGTVTIAGLAFTVDQAAAPCAFELTATGVSVPAVGGPGSVGVTANRPSCPWTAVADVAWITVTAGAAGSGSGTVAFSVAANTGDARIGTLTIAGHTYTVEQQAVPCAFELASPSAAFAAAGGSGSAGVVANIQTCGWTAVSHAAWVTITGGAAGTGNGPVAFAVAANAGAARTGTLTIAGATFTVLQGAAGCSYSLYSWSSSFFAEGGVGQTRVWTNQTSCTWNAFANVPWLTITGGAAGTGSDFVTFTVAANAGLARQGSLTVAGQTYWVYQDGTPCTYALSASGAEVGVEGGAGSVDVTASNPACPWTAVSSAPEWLTVTGGAAGSGNGTVSFAVGANAGAARSATLLIGGQVFTVLQASPPCTYGIAPAEQAFAAIGGSGTVTVTAAYTSCPWTATSDSAWLTVTAGAAGAGGGIVEFAVADNPGAPRTGTLTVAGHAFAVTQGEHGPQVRRAVKRVP